MWIYFLLVVLCILLERARRKRAFPNDRRRAFRPIGF